MKCGMAFPWQGNESLCNTLRQLPDALQYVTKVMFMQHKLYLGHAQLVCFECLCVCGVYFAVGQTSRPGVSEEPELYLPPLGWRGLRGPGQGKCRGAQSDGRWPDLMLHELFPSMQLLLGAVEWPRHSTVWETAVPAQMRHSRLFPWRLGDM